MHHHIQLIMWVLEIRTQIHMLTQQALTDSSLQPSAANFISPPQVNAFLPPIFFLPGRCGVVTYLPPA